MSYCFKILSVLCVILCLSGCFCKHNIITKAEEAVIIHPPKPNAVTLGNVQWIVYNRDKLMEGLKNNPNDSFVLFALTPENYLILAANIQDFIRYIKQQNAMIDYYRATVPSVSD